MRTIIMQLTFEGIKVLNNKVLKSGGRSFVFTFFVPCLFCNNLCWSSLRSRGPNLG